MRGQRLSGRKALAETPTPRRQRLDTIPKLRRELVRLYQDGRAGRIPAVDASRLASVLGLVARLIEGHELELRLIELERRMGER